MPPLCVSLRLVPLAPETVPIPPDDPTWPAMPDLPATPAGAWAPCPPLAKPPLPAGPPLATNGAPVPLVRTPPPAPPAPTAPPGAGPARILFANWVPLIVTDPAVMYRPA